MPPCKPGKLFIIKYGQIQLESPPPTEELGSCLPPTPIQAPACGALCSACLSLNAPREQAAVSKPPAGLLAGSGTEGRAVVLSYLLVEDVQCLLDVPDILLG